MQSQLKANISFPFHHAYFSLIEKRFRYPGKFSETDTVQPAGTNFSSYSKSPKRTGLQGELIMSVAVHAERSLGILQNGKQINTLGAIFIMQLKHSCMPGCYNL